MRKIVFAGLAALVLCSQAPASKASLPQQLGPFTLREEISLGEDGCGFKDARSADDLTGHHFVALLGGKDNVVVQIIWRPDDSVDIWKSLQSRCFTPVVSVKETKQAPWSASVRPAAFMKEYSQFFVPEESFWIAEYGYEEFSQQDTESGATTRLAANFRDSVLEWLLVDDPDLIDKYANEYWEEYGRALQEQAGVK